MTASPARLLAASALTRVRERGSFAHETVDALLAKAGLDARDVAFATRLAYGAIATRGTLDGAVARYLKADVRLEPKVADALAVSAYEILFARTPARAAVNEGVELVKAVQPRAAGLANAVLRKLAADADTFPWGDPQVSDEALARLYGHPTWLTTMWVSELGRETAEQVMAANNEPAPLYLAHMPFKRSFDDVMTGLSSAGAEPTARELSGCIEAGSSAQAVRSDELARHDVLVMDAGAQFAASCVPLSQGARVVELGAGRGSKSLWLAAQAHREGLDVDITAVDIHGFKLEALTRIARHLDVSAISTVVADATALPADAVAPGAHAVLVDAPCSGLGTLRRHPDRRWRAVPDEIATLSLLGTALLRSAASLVMPGGFVVYSTCTIARPENAQVVEGFLASEQGRGFSVVALDQQVPAEWRHYITSEGYFQSLPAQGGMDGHFVALLKRDA